MPSAGNGMIRAPKIGERVAYVGGLTVTACTGVVTAIYPTYYYDEDDNGDAIRETGTRPEREWHVAVKVDAIPDKWPYTGRDQFAPDVARLRKIKEQA